MTFMNYVLVNPLASTITEYETVVDKARLFFPGTYIPELYLEHCLVLINSFICLSGLWYKLKYLLGAEITVPCFASCSSANSGPIFQLWETISAIMACIKNL